MALGLGLAIPLSACGGDVGIPGDEVIGRFAFTAELLPGGCSFEELPQGDRFDFQGTFSRDTGGGGAWMTVGQVNRDGAWDGQRFDSTASAPRRFEVKGGCSQYDVEERLQVAVLSQSQDAALGGGCPEDAHALLADGAVPVDEAQGILPPGPVELGYDAVRACGVITHRVRSTAACATPVDCPLTWRVEGTRRQ